MAVTRAATTTDYSQRVQSRIRKPHGSPPSFLIYGRFKKGKTRFCSTAPNVLLVDPEIGADDLPPDLDIFPVEKWQDYDDLVKYLRKGDHRYQYVAIDGITKVNNLALRFVMSQEEEMNLNRKPGMVQKQDYNKSGELLKGLITSLQSLPIGKIYTAQERQIAGSEQEEDVDATEAEIEYVPDLPAGVRGHLCAAVNGIGRIYTVRKESERTPGKVITQRRLWLAQSERYDTGFRSNHPLPDYLVNPTVPRLVELIKNGKINAKD